MIRALLAVLPDLREPSVIPLFAILGGFLGGTRARFRKVPLGDRPAEIAEGAYVGTAVGLIVYTITNLVAG